MAEATASSLKAQPPRRRQSRDLDQFLKELIGIIHREEKVLNAFLNHLNRQKQYLLADQLEAFQGTVDRQEALIDEIKKLEEQRIVKIKELAVSEGMPEDEITLTHLIEITLGDVSDELKQLKENLSNLVEKIRRANRVNQVLVKRSLNFIEQNIGWMIDAADITRVYDPSGRTAHQTGTNVIVNKVM
jgi:flagellar biosynthesis/type III secretory pathway chaperone